MPQMSSVPAPAQGGSLSLTKITDPAERELWIKVFTDQLAGLVPNALVQTNMDPSTAAQIVAIVNDMSAQLADRAIAVARRRFNVLETL